MEHAKQKLVVAFEIDDPCFAAWLLEIAHAYGIPMGKAAGNMLRMIYDDDMATLDVGPTRLQ